LEEEFKIMKKKLDSLSDDAHTRKMLNYFDLDAWLESKISGHAFAKVAAAKR